MPRTLQFRVTAVLFFLVTHLPVAAAVREVVVRSESIGRNLQGIPAEQRVAVYVPPGYAEERDRYPVLFLLHGIGGDSRDWTERLGISELLDRLIRAKTIDPMIVVMPTAMTPLGGSFYIDSPTAGGWETFLSTELVAYIDENFRTRNSAAARAIAGHSMGGFGALRLAAAHPDVFSGTWAMSPCCLDLIEDLGHANQEWHETLRLRTPADLRAMIEARRFYPVSLLTISAAFSPNSEKAPFFADYPVLVEEGELKPNHPVQRRWREQLPVHRLPRESANLLKLKAIYLDYGVDEQFAHIPAGALRYSEALGRHSIPHMLVAYRGDHRDRIRERLEDFVLPMVSRQFDQ